MGCRGAGTIHHRSGLVPRVPQPPVDAEADRILRCRQHRAVPHREGRLVHPTTNLDGREDRGHENQASHRLPRDQRIRDGDRNNRYRRIHRQRVRLVRNRVRGHRMAEDGLLLDNHGKRGTGRWDAAPPRDHDIPQGGRHRPQRRENPTRHRRGLPRDGRTLQDGRHRQRRHARRQGNRDGGRGDRGNRISEHRRSRRVRPRDDARLLGRLFTRPAHGR